MNAHQLEASRARSDVPRLPRTPISQSHPFGPAVHTTHRWLSGVPVWVGRALQLVAIVMLVIACTDIAVPDGVYWGASYFSVLGVSPDPFVFNSLLLFFIGSASKRRLRGALICAVVLEIPTVLLPCVALLSAGELVPEYLDGVGVTDLAAAALALAFICLLVSARHEYSARIEPASGRRALIVAVSGIGFAVFTGVGLSFAEPTQIHGVTDLLLWSLQAATGIYPADWVFDGSINGLSVGVGVIVASISAAGFAVALWLLLRSAHRMRLLSESEELAVRRLLRDEYSEDALAYFATRRDKSVVFSRDQRAAIAYRVMNGVALASGDPLGNVGSWDAAIVEWLRVVRGYGWRPAVLAATENGANHYARNGMRGVELGDEAVLEIDPARRPELLRVAPVRSARRRAQQDGYTAQIRRQRDLSAETLQQFERFAEDWRGSARERGFSMALSRIGDPSDGDAIIVTAHDESERIMALLVFVPWNRDGLSLDVMRRSAHAVNGVNEFLIAHLVSEASVLGVRRISLNFAVFRDTLVRGARVGAGPLLRTKRRMLVLLSTHWQLDSLRRANEKYAPQWRPRFLMRSRQTPLVLVMWAVVRAEGFARGAQRCADIPAGTRSAAFLAQLEADGAAVTASEAALAMRSPRAEAARVLSERGVELYPAVVPRSAAIAEIIGGSYPVARGVSPVSLAGRVVAKRRHGGILFLDLRENHAEVQVIASADFTVEYGVLARVAVGDIISVTGGLGRSRSQELSLCVRRWRYAAKSLQAPPNRRTGLNNPEAQLRQRHVLFATSRTAAELLRTRSAVICVLRERLQAEGYLEVETPVLQRTHGGANARPFRTHINAYHRDLSLRIAPELALKKLIVGGFPQVFEIGRNFRNEGVDGTHNPEFTAVEAYRAFADYADMRVLAERVVKEMLSVVTGSPSLVLPDGSRCDVSAPWRVVSVCQALSDRTGVEISVGMAVSELHRVCARFGVDVSRSFTTGQIIERLYDELIEPEVTAPTFFCDFPADTSPLARPHRSIVGLSERWDLVACGMELGTAYSELVDPLEQRRRLTAQSLRAAGGCAEAMQLDEEFLAALEWGMPPTGGLGLGVDRVVMVATGATIRQTLAFPYLGEWWGARGGVG